MEEHRYTKDDIMYFPISGVETSPFIPVAVAFVISIFTSMGGVSGAFVLLPFQVSVLGFVSPAVSSTNLVYNIIAIPGGVYRYFREGRMAWPIVWVTVAGTLPGVFVGAVLRIKYLPGPDNFKIFAGCVLLYIAFRLLYDFIPAAIENAKSDLDKCLKKSSVSANKSDMPPPGKDRVISAGRFSIISCSYKFYGETFSFNPIWLFLLTLAVGIAGGIYGIGGGAIIAPFLITVFRLPVYTIAGAALFGTFLTSIVGVIFYTVIAPAYVHTGLAIVPDWQLGALFGVGGLVGTYCGARLQKYFPAKAIKLLLGFVILFIATKYILGSMI